MQTSDIKEVTWDKIKLWEHFSDHMREMATCWLYQWAHLFIARLAEWGGVDSMGVDHPHSWLITVISIYRRLLRSQFTPPNFETGANLSTNPIPERQKSRLDVVYSMNCMPAMSVLALHWADWQVARQLPWRALTGSRETGIVMTSAAGISWLCYVSQYIIIIL